MRVYLLVREEQNEHGFVDTDVVAAYRDRSAVEERVSAEVERARAGGLKVEGDHDVADGDWEVSFSVREQAVV